MNTIYGEPMNSLTAKSREMPPESSMAIRYPWYVHLFGGYALSGAFCWLLVAGLFWRKGRRLVAASVLVANLILLMVTGWTGIRLEMAWWRVESLMLGMNLLWALSAWLVQYRLFGPADPRYRLAEWRRWKLPLLTGLVLGSGFAVTMAVGPAVGERITALYKQGAVVRDSILWQFFKDLPMGLALGILAGWWWAGCRRFTTSHVVGFLAGIGLVMTAEIVFVGVFSMIVNGGDTAHMQLRSGGNWALVHAHLHGWPRFLAALSDIGYIAYIPLGMLFGAPSRIRDFLKRSAVIVPLILLLIFSSLLGTPEGWELIQGRLVHQTASSESSQRETAFKWVQVLLARYPNHAGWPHLAARLADAHYSHGEPEASRRIHQEIVDRFAHLNQWKTQVAMSRSILAAPAFGQPSAGPRLDIPLVNYQDYLTQNWMALLGAARYWRGEDKPVSELLVRLRAISKSDDGIELPKLTRLTDLDDAASSLGLGMTILPADGQGARALLEAGIPVVVPVYQTFYLLHAVDDSRQVVKAYCFGQLSEKTRSLAVKEAQEVLMLEAEGHGRSQDLLRRIGREADCMWHLDQWQTGRLKDAAGWMAAIHPSDGHKMVAEALGRDPRALARAHRGRLAAMMALSYFDNADPINCIRWAQIASQSIDEPLVWQAAYLGLTLWSKRSQRIGTAFQLEKQFAVLDGVNRFLDAESVGQFTQATRERFTADQAAGRLTWPVRWRLLWLLDRHDAHDRRQMVALLEANVATNPADASQWRLLADLYALDEDHGARAKALAEAWSAAPSDATTALAWASACVLLDDLQQVEQILEAIDSAKVRHESGYYFCLGALSEWKNKPRAALEYYARATDLCRYRPEYFRRYGRLLMAQGNAEAAEKAIAWANRIDSGGWELPAAMGDSSKT